MRGDAIRYDDLPIERMPDENSNIDIGAIYVLLLLCLFLHQRGLLYLINYTEYKGRNGSSALAMLLQVHKFLCLIYELKQDSD